MAKEMSSILHFSGDVFNGDIDLRTAQFVCVPSKPHYAEVDVCIRANVNKGPNIVISGIDNNCLSFDEKKKLGYEIAKRWNNVSTLAELLERSINGLKWYKSEHPQSWSETDEEHLLECVKALESAKD